MKILIADDERDLCDVVCRILLRAGYQCVAAYSGMQVLEMYDEEKPDLVILDVMMPEVNGFDVCRMIREKNKQVPIIMLSAKGDIVDKSIGFNAGCDDYVTKPFVGEELVLRVAANLRRSSEDGSEKKYGTRAVVNIGELEIRLKRGEVLLRGRKVALSPKEFQIIALLANHPGEVFSAQDILAGAWSEGEAPSSEALAVFIRKIRNKIEDDPSRPEYLQTVWRQGYRLGSERQGGE